MRIGSVLKHSSQAALEGALIASLVVGLMAGTALAAKGGGHTSSMSITVVTVVDSNHNLSPNWADTVHFTFSTSNPTPIVSVTCTQNGGLVFGDSHPYYWPNVWNDNGNVTLSSPAWTSGAADCQVVVKGTSNGRTVTLGSATFHVDA